jgi:alpha-L-arabinofuranosidase
LKYKQPIKYKGEVIVMTSGNSMDGNSFKEPEKVVPMTKDVNGLRNTFNYECPANAIVIIHLRYKKGINGFVDCC